MNVKHNYQCTFCTQQKTCFVFSDFNTLFALCRSCYDQLAKDSPLFEVQDNQCSFCGKTKEVKKIEGFDDALFFADQFICRDCLQEINELVARNHD